RPRGAPRLPQATARSPDSIPPLPHPQPVLLVLALALVLVLVLVLVLCSNRVAHRNSASPPDIGVIQGRHLPPPMRQFRHGADLVRSCIMAGSQFERLVRLFSVLV